MNRSHPHPAMLSQSALLAVASLVAIAVLIVLLWNPSFRKASSDEELVLYCAAGLIKPVEEIAHDYQEKYHVKILIEPDGSGKLLSKMRVARDRGDLFLAAEESYIHDARKEGLVAEAIPVAMQLQGINISYQLISMLPYLLTIVVVAGAVGRATPPAADGQPYVRA